MVHAIPRCSDWIQEKSIFFALVRNTSNGTGVLSVKYNDSSFFTPRMCPYAARLFSIFWIHEKRRPALNKGEDNAIDVFVAVIETVLCSCTIDGIRDGATGILRYTLTVSKSSLKFSMFTRNFSLLNCCFADTLVYVA